MLKKPVFKTTKFTALLLAFLLLLGMLPLYAFAADEKDHTGDHDIMRQIHLSYKLKGATDYTVLDAPYKIDDITKIETFRLNHSFELKDIIDESTGTVSRSVHAGDYYLIDLPEKLIVTNPASGSILGNNDAPIAHVGFIEEAHNNWKLKIEFTDYVDDLNEYEIFGNMNFDFQLDMDAVGDGESTQFYIPIDDENGLVLDVTKPVPPPTKPLSLTKTAASYTHQTRELVWQIQIAPETGIFQGCVFTDTLNTNLCELKSIKHGNVLLIQGTDYTYDSVSGNIVYTIPEGRNGTGFQTIEITTIVKSSVYSNHMPTEITNTANLSGGEELVNIDSNTAKQTITPDWLKKSGTPYEGNKIKWTLSVNTTQQNMYNAVVTDRLQADVQMDKTSLRLGDTVIPVYDNAYTPLSATEVYAVYVKNADQSATLMIYLPRGLNNASNAVQTLTFITSVIPPENESQPSPVYNNTASLTANYVGENGVEGIVPQITLDQIGVGIPHVSVQKSAQTLTTADKQNGTITWTIQAASNLSNYGKAVITDTLPDDQDFIAEEIYWGNQKINGTTNPSAQISPDGRTLTITFSLPKALAVQQNFTVKTKIKTEVYGQNMKRDFTNHVNTTLFDPTNSSPVTSAAATGKINVQNTVVAKSAALYQENTTRQGINPTVTFTITVNGNLMPLSSIIVSDDLNRIVTEFKKNGDSAFQKVDGVQWLYLPGTLKITKAAGTADNLDLDAIAGNAVYQNNILTVNFGSGVQVNDKYVITFSAEMPVSQNDIFKNNGAIRCNGNIACIEGTGLKTGVISSPATENTAEIKNEVLGKAGTHMVNEQQALWTINLNQHRVTLRNTKVIDILPEGLTLDPTSIRLYSNVIGADGNFIPSNQVETNGEAVDFTYTYLPATMAGYEGRYVLTVTLPDAHTAYTLKFATDIDKKLLGTAVSNSAYYAGADGTDGDSDTTSMTFSHASGGGSNTKSAVTVFKKSKDTGKALDTATFDLHWLRNGNPDDPVFVRTLSTSEGSVIFRGLTRGETYTITETGAPEGYLLDEPTPIPVTAPSEGTADAQPITFYNTPIKTGSWTPSAVKRLDGKHIIRPFRFELLQDSVTVMEGVTKDALANGDYTVAFSLTEDAKAKDILEFTDSHIFNESDPKGTSHLTGIRTFTMREIPSVLPGYGFDTTIYTLVVKAYNIKGQDTLKLVIEDEQGNVLSQEDGSFLPAMRPLFLNTYRATGSIQLSAEKTVLGHALADEQFTFELYEGTTLIQTTKNTSGIPTGNNRYTGNVVFDLIHYTQQDVGTKVYRIIEKDTSLPGYSYDRAEYTVTVLVSDNDNGKLTSTIQSIVKTVAGELENVDRVMFTNTYTTNNTDVQLRGTKTLTGRALEQKQFFFELKEVTTQGIWIRDIACTTNNAEDIVFPKLTYRQSDIGLSYYYEITETDADQPGYTYDTSVYTIRVDILDNHNGTISARKTIYKNGIETNAVSFTNIYKARGTTTVSGTKELTGKQLPAGQFTFTMQETNPDHSAVIGEKLTAVNNEQGNFTFPALYYTEADAGNTYYYDIAEFNAGAGGYTYDPVVYTLAITVTDNGDGTLTTEQVLIAPENAEEIRFFNTYTTMNTSAAFTAQKILEGRTLEAEQFTFLLNQVTAEGALVQRLQSVTNTQDGYIEFSPVLYTQTDMGNTYYYEVFESLDNHMGYGYDRTIYTVKVDVIDNGDGTLSAVKTILREGRVVPGMVFTNSYTTTGTTVAFTAEKVLVGQKLEAGQFQFLLTKTGVDGQPDVEIETAVNQADGIIRFRPIAFTQADMGNTYRYTIREVAGEKNGYTYDESVYTLTVEILDNGDGTLQTKTDISKTTKGSQSAASELKFVNQFKAKEKPSIPGTGDDMTADLFIGMGALSFAAVLILRRKRKEA